MWGIDPSRMCRQHLLGEHVELHMMVGTLRKGISMAGYYYSRGLVDTDQIVPRHDALVEEMVKRGMRHRSPLPEFENPHQGAIDPGSVAELLRRCGECR